MAIYGNGNDYDITFKAEANLKTTTSQYKCVSMIPGTSTAYNRTVQMCFNTGVSANSQTIASYFVIGVNQTYMSSNSDSCNVRVFGVSKAECAVSIGAGQFVCAYAGASTTSRIGTICPVTEGVSMGGASISAHRVILGRALENGSTGTVISIFVNPVLADIGTLGTIGA